MENSKSNSNNIDEIFSDEFIKKILLTKSNDEMKIIFKEKGLNLTDEQAENFKNNINIELTKLKEVTEKELQEVNGGQLDKEKIINSATQGAGYGIAGGGLLGAGVGFLGSFMHDIYNGKKNKVRRAFYNAAVMSGIGAASGVVVGGITGTGIGMT